MKYLYVVPIGTIDRDVLATIEQTMAAMLGIPFRRMDAMEEPVYAYDISRKQYNSVTIMRTLIAACPDDALKMLAVTEADLFIPMLTFIFGHAQLGGNVALLSLARLHQEFYALPEDRALFLERSRKEALHEVGHTFGQIHCNDRGCPMSLSTTIQQVDEKGGVYCERCRISLQETNVMITVNHISSGQSGGVQ